MAYTADQIAALEAAIASGVLTVRIGTVLTTYQSLSEMRAQLNRMRAELGIVPPGKSASYVTPVTTRGL